jgi:hypothetical protein
LILFLPSAAWRLRALTADLFSRQFLQAIGRGCAISFRKNRRTGEQSPAALRIFATTYMLFLLVWLFL